jgi:hypothetical protein
MYTLESSKRNLKSDQRNNDDAIHIEGYLMKKSHNKYQGYQVN